MDDKSDGFSGRGVLEDIRTVASILQQLLHDLEASASVAPLPQRTSLTIKEFAVDNGVSVSTVRRWIRDRGLPSVKVGHLVRIPMVEAERWLRGHDGGDPA